MWGAYFDLGIQIGALAVGCIILRAVEPFSLKIENKHSTENGA